MTNWKKDRMNSLGALAVTIAAASIALALGSRAVADSHATESTAAPGSKTARGEYLVKIMGCNDCHTPFEMGDRGPEPDMTRMLSGHPQDVSITAGPAMEPGPWLWAGAVTNTAFAGPWGVSFTANLTPDPETGIGRWTEATFVQAIRTGRHEGQGRPILPPMPWPMYRNATDEDLSAVFAYLQNIPAISNRVPQPVEPPESR